MLYQYQDILSKDGTLKNVDSHLVLTRISQFTVSML